MAFVISDDCISCVLLALSQRATLSTLSTQTLALSAVLARVLVLLALLHRNN